MVGIFMPWDNGVGMQRKENSRFPVTITAAQAWFNHRLFPRVALYLEVLEFEALAEFSFTEAIVRGFIFAFEKMGRWKEKKMEIQWKDEEKASFAANS